MGERKALSQAPATPRNVMHWQKHHRKGSEQMAKQKKNNHSVIPPVPREAIAAVRGEEDFVELLRRDLEWPIPMSVQRLADVAIPHDLLNNN